MNYSKKPTSLIDAGANGGALVPFQPQADSLTYEPFFGLEEKPFSLNADPRFVYGSPMHRATRESLLAGIRRREGLLVLTGEIGTGKTTLCHGVLRELGRKTYCSIVPDPFASREDLLKMLLIDFGVLSIEELTDGRLRQASRTELGYLLSEFLNSLPADAFVVVVIDEAQNLSLPLIEETRILSDTFGARGRMQIVFAGQPELHAKLKLPEMRQVDQRVCGYHRLAPMNRDGVAGYIQHRLEAAGGSPDRELFPAEIIDALHRRTGGVPRLINRVCDRALQLAFEKKAEAVNREILETALIELGSATLSPNWDSIMFADAPAAAAPPVFASEFPRAPRPTPEPAPVPAVPAAKIAPTGDHDEDEHFQKQIDSWVDQELAPASRARTRPLPPPPAVPTADAAPARRPASRTAPKSGTAARAVTTDWPRHLRSETYMQRLWRIWAKRAAIALGVFVAFNVALALGSMLLANQAAPELPVRAESPTGTVPANAPAEAPGSDAPSAAAPQTAAPVAEPAAVSGDYFVSVGMFASRERADQLVDALTQAGLPAMQRPFRLGEQDVQQIVLGPFFSRDEAVDDLRRLQALGGYNDASVIDAPLQ